MRKYNSNEMRTDHSVIEHYEDLGLKERLSNGFDHVKNSRVGRFIYSDDLNRFSLYHTQVEGQALRDFKDGVKETAQGLFYLAKGASKNVTDKDWRERNKWPIIGGVAVGLAIPIILQFGARVERVGYMTGIGQGGTTTYGGTLIWPWHQIGGGAVISESNPIKVQNFAYASAWRNLPLHVAEGGIGGAITAGVIKKVKK